MKIRTMGDCLGGEIFEKAVLADPVLKAELLPELHPDLVPALPHLYGDDLARHFLRSGADQERIDESSSPSSLLLTTGLRNFLKPFRVPLVPTNPRKWASKMRGKSDRALNSIVLCCVFHFILLLFLNMRHNLKMIF